MKLEKGIKLMRLFAVIALIVSAYLIYIHYTIEGGSFCDINGSINCSLVNGSSFAKIFNIPVSVLGFSLFLVVIFLMTWCLRDKKIEIKRFVFNKYTIFKALLIIFILSLAYSFYLIYIELFVLHSICILCVALDILVVIELVLIIMLLKNKEENLKKRR